MGRSKPVKVYKADTKKPYSVDRTEWPRQRGPWDSEPDRFPSWTTGSGLTGVIVRGGYGALCGYVRVPQDHPLYRTRYQRVHVEVHGGLTFSSMGRATTVCDDKTLKRIRYGGRKGRSAKRKLRREWWFGFDCGHMGDTTPYVRDGYSDDYKDEAYLRGEVEHLAYELTAELGFKVKGIVWT